MKNEKSIQRCHQFTHAYTCNLHNFYASWDMECNRNNFLSFWAIFCPFTQLTASKIKILKKWKKHLEIYLEKHHFILVYYKWQSCDLWPLRYRWSATNRIFSHFGPFLDQLKILKNEKKHQDIIILHKCIIYDNHLRYMVPEIWSTTDRFFVILGHLPHEKLKNSKSWKTKTSTCSVIFYTCVPKIMILCLFPIKLAILSFHTCVP